MIHRDDLSDTARRQILLSIRTGPKSVNSIVEETGLKQPNVSNHLGRLRNRNIVARTKQGRQAFYSLASAEVDAILEALLSVKRREPAGVDFDHLINDFLACATEGDEDGAIAVLERAFNESSHLVDVYEGLLTPAMRCLGQMYENGEIDDANEHMASEITLRCMSRTVHIAGPAKRNGKRCILGCPPNEWHVIGLRMASDVLRLNGWRTLFCGANVPIRSFLTAVHHNRPDLTLLSCSSEESYPSTLQLVKELAIFRRDPREFTIGVGGRFSSGQRQELEAMGTDFITSDLKDFSQVIVPQLA